MPLSNDLAALIGFACEAVLWGAYAILFGVSLILLLRRGKGRVLNVPIATGSCILFLSCTAHFAIEFNHFHTTLGLTGVDGYANETKPLVGADILISLCDLFGDFILIYRCWILWGRNYWVIILPTLCALGGFGCIAGVVDFILRLTPTSPVPPAAIVPLTTAGYALPLCTNVMATGLISFKIWHTTRLRKGDAALHSTTRLARNAIAIIVESGALYLATQLVFVVLVNTTQPAQAIVAVMAVQIYGIAPTLIIIRVGLGISVESTHFGPASRPIAWASHTTDAVSTERHRTGTGALSTTKFDESLELKDVYSRPSAQVSEA